MATVRAFRAFGYHERFNDELPKLIAPPYDVIPTESIPDWHARHRYNITRLTLPDSHGEDPYKRAAELLRSWREENVIVPNATEALSLYSQRFINPLTGKAVMRTGILTLLRLEPFETGNVLPHERTLRGPRIDRMRLLEETRAQLEPIFGMTSDLPDGELHALIERQLADNEPDLVVTDEEGVRQIVRHVTDRAVIDRFVRLMATRPVIIVDGHHRYVSGLEYRNKVREERGVEGEELPSDYILIHIVPMSDPGLVILPTHRVIHSVDGLDFDTVVERLNGPFTVEELNDRKKGFDSLSERGEGSFLLFNGSRTIVATVTASGKTVMQQQLGCNNPLADVDTAILHELILDEIVGLTTQMQESGSYIRYVKSIDDAVVAADDPTTNFVVAMTPPRFEQVEAVSRSGQVMPQKSTYFVPKLTSGLLLHVHDEDVWKESMDSADFSPHTTDTPE